MGSREAWERARWLMLATVQPHSRKRLKPTDVLKFPWDGNYGHEQARMSREEHERRMADAIRRMGKTL